MGVRIPRGVRERPALKDGLRGGMHPLRRSVKPCGPWRCRLAGPGHLSLKEEIAGSNPVAATQARVPSRRVASLGVQGTPASASGSACLPHMAPSASG